jgi:SAM-dependent methyltransferase
MVRKNRWGFYEIDRKPSPEELRQYYADKYYQEDRGTYEKSYTQEEIRFFRSKLEQKFLVVCELLPGRMADKTLLDVGAGEGWALSFFRARGWSVTGLDYSTAGCARHNPACLEHLIVGDIFDKIAALSGKNVRYQVILLDNVLEHVADPLDLLQSVHRLLAADGALIIEVPNDFSRIQEYALSKGYVSRPYWVVAPDHLSYFTKEGLLKLCQEAGFTSERILGDYPIDFNLLNENTNYIEKKELGKSCHRSRVEIENLIHAISPEKANRLYAALGDLGLGRSIIAFLKPVH